MLLSKAFSPTLVLVDILLPPLPTFIPFTIISALTCNLATGEVVPIPTLPLELILIFSEPAVANPRVSEEGVYIPVSVSAENEKAGSVVEPFPPLIPVVLLIIGVVNVLVLGLYVSAVVSTFKL